jgi:hypothetical protein
VRGKVQFGSLEVYLWLRVVAIAQSVVTTRFSPIALS